MTIGCPKSRIVGALVSLMVSAGPATAHEFWISPEIGRLQPGDTLVADLKVGLMLKGESYPYLSDRFRSFDIAVAEMLLPVTGLDGDTPALNDVTVEPGLNVIALETIAFRATYDDWAVFRKYLNDEGLEQFEQLHRERGLPEQGFAERYTRYAKALVQVGSIELAHRDFPVGMPLELVADANPYADGSNKLPVTLTWQGEPIAERQINVFQDQDGTITRTSVFTDEQGRAVVPITGSGEYLLNAVHLEPADAPPVVWESHWATLSFRL